MCDDNYFNSCYTYIEFYHQDELFERVYSKYSIVKKNIENMRFC